MNSDKENYDELYDRVMGPPRHFNCRCVLTGICGWCGLFIEVEPHERCDKVKLLISEWSAGHGMD